MKKVLLVFTLMATATFVKSQVDGYPLNFIV